MVHPVISRDWEKNDLHKNLFNNIPNLSGKGNAVLKRLTLIDATDKDMKASAGFGRKIGQWRKRNGERT
jgi:hypothetical protein